LEIGAESARDFNVYLTDLEVMGYEQEVSGWKIALNVTEFLMPAGRIEAIESRLELEGRTGCACSGVICVDLEPGTLPDSERSLPLAKDLGL
jgi:hypothetical protein